MKRSNRCLLRLLRLVPSRAGEAITVCSHQLVDASTSALCERVVVIIDVIVVLFLVGIVRPRGSAALDQRACEAAARASDHQLLSGTVIGAHDRFGSAA